MHLMACTRAVERGFHGFAAVGNDHSRGFVDGVVICRARRPDQTRRALAIRAFGLEGGCRARSGKRRCVGIVGQKSAIGGEMECHFAQCAVSRRPIGKSRRHSVSSSWLTGKKRDLVEEAQQPRLSVPEVLCLTIGIPHLNGAAEQLVSAWALHAVNAEIGAANANDIGRRPGARGIVFRGDQAMARVHRRRHRRTEINVAQAPKADSSRRRRCDGRLRWIAKPFMRRMNSILSGVQGASSRTALI